MLGRNLAASLFLLLTTTAVGASFTLEQVRSYSFPEQPVAAAATSEVAWLVNDHGRRNVWVATGPNFTPRQLTSYMDDDGQQLSSLQLSADGSFAVYVRGGGFGANWDENSPVNPASSPAGGKVEIWIVRVDRGPPRLIAEGISPVLSPDGRRLAYLKDGAVWMAQIDGAQAPGKVVSAAGEIGSLTWSPDSGRLAFVTSRESHSLIGVYTDEHTPILWLAPSASRDGTPCWSPDGKRIAFIRTAGDGGVPRPLLEFQPEPWELWIADANTGEATLRWSSGKSLRDRFLDVLEWASGDRIVFKSYQDGWQHLYSLPASSGEPLLLTPGNYMVEDVKLSPDRRHLVFNANTGNDAADVERRHLYKVSVDGRAPEPLTSGTGIEWSPVITHDDRLVFLSATAQRPPEPATLSKRDGTVRLLAPDMLPRDYPEKQLVTPQRITFKAEDGMTVHGQLFEPRQRSGKHPALVYIHGGPERQMLLGWHYMEYYSNDYALNQYLASRGYVVLAVNYRLGIGYGHDFQFPPNAGERGASEYRDVRAAGRYLQQRPDVDAGRVGLYGGSYGGYLTAMGLAHDSDLFVVGVDIHGVHNWTQDYGLDKLFVRKRYEVPVDAQRALDVAWQASPVAAVSQWKSPVLFIHGDDDRNVRFAQTVDLVQRLSHTGVHYETMVLVDETHEIFRYANALKMNRATAEFLDRYLMPAGGAPSKN